MDRPANVIIEPTTVRRAFRLRLVISHEHGVVLQLELDVGLQVIAVLFALRWGWLDEVLHRLERLLRVDAKFVGGLLRIEALDRFDSPIGKLCNVLPYFVAVDLGTNKRQKESLEAKGDVGLQVSRGAGWMRFLTDLYVFCADSYVFCALVLTDSNVFCALTLNSLAASFHVITGR